MMTKARALANLLSQGNIFADSQVAASEITGLHTVATTGSYADLVNKPTVVSHFTNDANYASTTYVNTQMSNMVASAPAALDTLNELAAALGNDANFSATTATALGNRLRVDTAAQSLSSTQKTNAKTNLDLQNVENKSSATIRGELTSSNVTTALGFTPYNSTNPNAYISGNQTITFSGDATGSGAVTVALTLANSGVTAGTYGSSTNIPQLVVDAKGRVTSVSNVAVSIPSGALTFTGDVTGSGSTGSSTALTLANSGVTAGTYTKVTVDAKGRVTVGATLASADLPTYTGSLTSAQVTGALGFTPYNSTNPSGYITNTGNARVGVENNGTLVGTRRNINFIPGTGVSLTITDDSANEEVDVTVTNTGVTSVSGTGTVSGLTLSGTVTTTGSLTLGGTLTLTSAQITSGLGYTPLSLAGGSLTGALTSSGSYTSTDNANVNGSNFVVNTTNKSVLLYAYDVQRSGSTVGGIRIDGSGIFASGTTIGGNVALHAGNYTTYAPYVQYSRYDGNLNSLGVSQATSGIYTIGGSYTNGPGAANLYGTLMTFWNVDISTQFWTSYNGDAYWRKSAGGTFAGAAWRTFLDSSNYTSYSPTLTGSGASGTWGISITGNAGTAGGLSVHAGVNNEANKIVRTDGSGYIYTGWINTTSGDNGTTAIDRIYASHDTWLRYYTPANFRTVLDVPTRGGTGASGTWGISITGNAATASRVTSGNLTPASTSFNNALIPASGSNRVLTFDGNGSLPSVWWSNGTRAYGAIDAQDPGLAFWANNGSGWQQQMAVNYGNVTINTDIRTPILYDSNDTGYYLNPNSSSRLSSTYTDNSYSYGWFRTYNNNGLYNETHGNHWYATGNNYWNLAGNNTTHVGIILRTGGHQGTVRGYVYADNNNSIGFLNSNGSWRFRVVGDDYSLADGTSMRAQLFYDSNDTNFYVDPASTSVLNQLNVGGDPVITAIQSQSDFPNGTLVQTNINATGWSGNSFRLEATGKSYGLGPPFMFMAEGYLYNDTIINANGIHLGVVGFSYIRVFNYNGNIAFWWPRASYWNSFEVRVIVADGAGDNRDRVTSITDSTEPSGTKKVTINMASYMRSDISTTNADTIRATNFRVSNAFYLGENNWFLNNTNSGWYSNVKIQSAEDMRAPIYYDSNDTGYYGDFASTSRLNQLITAGRVVIGGNFSNNSYASVSSTRLLFGGGDDPDNYFIGTNLENYGGNYTKLDLRWHTGIRMGAQQQYGGIRFFDSEDLGTQVFAISKDGAYAQANQSMRAPIFYDIDNTSYYLDPTSTTAIRTVGSWRADAATWDGEFAGKMQYHSNNWYLQFSSNMIFRNSGGSNIMTCDSSGNVTFSGNVTAYSDRNKKTNITTLTTAQQYFDKIDAKNYVWKDTGKEDIGFIAQDVEAAGLSMFVHNNEVHDPNTGEIAEVVKSLDYGKMVAVLWQTVKELKQELDALKSKQ